MKQQIFSIFTGVSFFLCASAFAQENCEDRQIYLDQGSLYSLDCYSICCGYHGSDAWNVFADVPPASEIYVPGSRPFTTPPIQPVAQGAANAGGGVDPTAFEGGVHCPEAHDGWTYDGWD